MCIVIEKLCNLILIAAYHESLLANVPSIFGFAVYLISISTVSSITMEELELL